MHALIAAIRRLFRFAPPVGKEPFDPPHTSFEFFQGYVGPLAELEKKGVIITSDMHLDILDEIAVTDEWKKMAEEFRAVHTPSSARLERMKAG
jgi:hypothetical protein